MEKCLGLLDEEVILTGAPNHIRYYKTQSSKKESIDSLNEKDFLEALVKLWQKQ